MALSAITGMAEISCCERGHRTHGGGGGRVGVGALREVHICLDYPSREGSREHRRGRP